MISLLTPYALVSSDHPCQNSEGVILAYGGGAMAVDKNADIFQKM